MLPKSIWEAMSKRHARWQPWPQCNNQSNFFFPPTLPYRVVLTKRARRLGERRRALRFQAIGVFLEEDNAVGALAKGQLGDGRAATGRVGGESFSLQASL